MGHGRLWSVHDNSSATASSSHFSLLHPRAFPWAAALQDKHAGAWALHGPQLRQGAFTFCGVVSSRGCSVDVFSSMVLSMGCRRYLLHCGLSTGYREIRAPPWYLHRLRRISAWDWLHLVSSLTSFHFKRNCNQGLKNVSYFVSGWSPVAGKCPLMNQQNGAGITVFNPFIRNSHAKSKHRRLV